MVRLGQRKQKAKALEPDLSVILLVTYKGRDYYNKACIVNTGTVENLPSAMREMEYHVVRSHYNIKKAIEYDNDPLREQNARVTNPFAWS